jgi:hypothetical protein
MSDERALQTREVVDLLATWGAAARPGMADLLAVLADFGRADPRASIGAVLEAPGLVLPEALRREAQGALAAERGAPGELEGLAGRLREAARASVVAQREVLREELESWSPLLEGPEIDAVLEHVWRHDGDAELADHVSAARDLETARGIVGQARWRVDAELRKRIGEVDGAPDDADRARRIRALDGGRPAEILAVRREVVAARPRGPASPDTDAEGAARRLAELRERAASLAGADGIDGTTRGLLPVALGNAEEALAEATAGTQPDGPLQRFAIWERLLRATMDSAADATARSAQRQALARSLAQRIREEAGESELGEAQRELADARTDAALLKAFAGAVSALDAHRARSRGRSEAARTELREAAEKLQAELRRLAADLPTEQVAGTRVLLERIGEALAGGDPGEVAGLADDARKRSGQLGKLADLGQRHRKDRLAGERKRLGIRADHLLRATRGRSAKRIESLARRIEEAPEKALPELSDELTALSARVGNAVRLRTAKLLDRLDGRGGADPREANLRAAFAEDDLPAMVELEQALRKSAGRPRSHLLAAGGAVAAVLGAAGWLLLSGDRVRKYSYELQLAESVTPCEELWLVQDGNVEKKLACAPGRELSAELEPGTYEVFVNRRYTGRVIRVPDDAKNVQSIPVP